MNVHFGGPDLPRRALRDLLEAHVDGVPPGGSVDWMTYYFRDVALAEALMRAHQRGVRVSVCIEGRPRHRGANDRVIAILRRGIADGLRVEKRLLGASHLHTKLYAFSGPTPHALVGSFNPSGNEPDDAVVIADIGDQDRGHNLLVEIDDPRMRQALTTRTDVELGDAQAFFFPRWGAHPLDKRVAGLGERSSLRIAASHIRDRRFARRLTELAKRGGKVEVLTHHTLRRTPEALVQYLRASGVTTYRYEHPDAPPMHAKFILAEDVGRRWSSFGSYNLTLTSRWLNQELLMFSDDPQLWEALDHRWREIMAEPWVKP